MKKKVRGRGGGGDKSKKKYDEPTTNNIFSIRMSVIIKNKSIEIFFPADFIYKTQINSNESDKPRENNNSDPKPFCFPMLD